MVVASKEDEKDPLVCSEEVPVGSRFPKQVCRRQSDIDARRNQTQNEITTKPQVKIRGF